MRNPRELASAVQKARKLATRLSTVVFRSIHLSHFSNFETVQPLFAARGGLTGSRFVPPEGPAALYAAFHPATAYREGNQDFFRLAATPAGQNLIRMGGLRPDPVVIISAHVRASILLDLRDEDTRHLLGIQNVREIRGPWKGVPHAPTQVLGEIVFRDRHFEGIVYPSVRNPGFPCLILFPDRLRRRSRIHFIDRTSGLTSQLP